MVTARESRKKLKTYRQRGQIISFHIELVQLRAIGQTCRNHRQLVISKTEAAEIFQIANAGWNFAQFVMLDVQMRQFGA